MREPDLLRCGRSEEALWVDGGMIRSNLHAHTDRSDGLYPIRMIAQIAARSRSNIAVTDHNIAPEHPGPWPEGLIPGIEITSREGVDVVVLGTLASMQRLFDEHVRRALHPTRPRTAPTSLSIHEIVALAAHRIIAHYGTVEGLSVLPPEEQARVLAHADGNTFLELNALTTSHNNALARRVAADWNRPLLRTGDTHRGVRQYSASGSDLPAGALPEGPAPLVDRLLDTLASEQAPVSHRLHRPSGLELLGTGIQIVRKNGAVSTAQFLLKTARRALGYIPAAVEAGIPKKLPRLGRRVITG